VNATVSAKLLPLAVAWLALAPPVPSGPSPAVEANRLALEAAAVKADAGHGQILFLKHCVECHGPRAWGDGPREIPTLAGQQERYLVTQLARFATGARPGTETHGAAMHDTLQPPDVDRPQALADLAAWLVHAPRDPEPEHGDGRALAAAARAYARDCAGCHGAEGEGGVPQALQAVPAIAGQHYSYLLVQLRSFTAGRRSHVLFTLPGAPSASEQQALADYLSRLTPPAPAPAPAR